MWPSLSPGKWLLDSQRSTAQTLRIPFASLKILLWDGNGLLKDQILSFTASLEVHPRRPHLLLHFHFLYSSPSMFPRKYLTSVWSHPPNNQPMIKNFLSSTLEFQAEPEERKVKDLLILPVSKRTIEKNARAINLYCPHNTRYQGTNRGKIVWHAQDCRLGIWWNWAFGMAGNDLLAVFHLVGRSKQCIEYSLKL